MFDDSGFYCFPFCEYFTQTSNKLVDGKEIKDEIRLRHAIELSSCFDKYLLEISVTNDVKHLDELS